VALPQSAHIIAHWAANSLALANNDPVTSWTDSVNSIVAAQSNGAKQPIFKTNIYGGRPSVRFDGSNDLLTIATPGALATALDTRTYSVMIVFQKLSNTVGGFGTLFSFTATTVGGNVYYICDDSRVQRYPASIGSYTTPFTSLNSFTTYGNTSGVGGALALSGLERTFVNGTCIPIDTIKAPGGTTASFAIGCDATEYFPVNADIFEIYVWDVELTPPESLEFHDYICGIYSQTTPWNSLSHFTVFDGDSLTQGVGATTVGYSYPYVAAQSLSLSYGQWSNCGIGTLLMSQMTSKFSADIAPYATLTGKNLKIAAFEWYNQRGADPTPRNNSLAYLSAVRSSTIKVAFGTSTDSTDSEIDRGAYDSYFDANHTSATIDAYVSTHTSTHIGPDGSVTTYPTYFSADSLHLSNTGYAELAGLFVTGLNGITFGGVPQSYSYSAVGGLQTGGAATKIKGRVSVASGGLQTGGAITESRGHVPAASGGLIISGSANETRGHVPASSGGITLGGNVIDIRGTVPAPSGGLQLGGHANMSSSGLQSYIYSASGGLSLSGFAATIRTVGKTSSGGVVLSGAATILPTYMTQTVARPVTDTTPGAWLPSAGIDLFAMVDEVVADDADYIYATTASTCKLALNAVTDPLTSSGQVVSYRAWSPTSGGLVVKLMQGATVIATWTHVTLPTAATTYNQALTAGECDAITNYATLSVQMESTV